MPFTGRENLWQTQTSGINHNSRSFQLLVIEKKKRLWVYSYRIKDRGLPQGTALC